MNDMGRNENVVLVQKRINDGKYNMLIVGRLLKVRNGNKLPNSFTGMKIRRRS